MSCWTIHRHRPRVSQRLILPCLVPAPDPEDVAVQLSTESVWLRLNAEIRQFLRRRVADDHTADDLLQETMLRIHRNLDKVRDSDRLVAWVYRIARNVLHDHARSIKATVQLAIDITIPQSDVQSACGNTGAWLREMIHQIPSVNREAVELSELHGLSDRKVAEQLGISLPAAKSRILRGRAALKRELEQCCRFEFGPRGKIIDYEPKPERKVCRDC